MPTDLTDDQRLAVARAREDWELRYGPETDAGRENFRRLRGLAAMNQFGGSGPLARAFTFLDGLVAMPFATPLDLARTSLAAAHAAGSGTITVLDASPFGAPTTTAPVRVTAVRAADQARVNFLVTGRAGNVLTVWPIDGYVDIALSPDDLVGAYPTAGTFADIHAAIVALQAAFAASFHPDGSFMPPRLPDSAAVANSVYYSTTLAGLAYKDPSGSVHVL